MALDFQLGSNVQNSFELSNGFGFSIAGSPATMKKNASYFEGHDPQLIYIAKRLKDATRLEALLTEAGIDFGVEADEYHGGVIFRRVRTGAFFYVLPEFREQAVTVLLRNGCKPEPDDQT